MKKIIVLDWLSLDALFQDQLKKLIGFFGIRKLRNFI